MDVQESSNGCPGIQQWMSRNPGISRNKRSNENPSDGRTDIRFIGKSTKLIIERECGTAKW
jgi:hypothetical protein